MREPKRKGTRDIKKKTNTNTNTRKQRVAGGAPVSRIERLPDARHAVQRPLALIQRRARLRDRRLRRLLRLRLLLLMTMMTVVLEVRVVHAHRLRVHHDLQPAPASQSQSQLHVERRHFARARRVESAHRDRARRRPLSLPSPRRLSSLRLIIPPPTRLLLLRIRIRVLRLAARIRAARVQRRVQRVRVQPAHAHEERHVDERARKHRDRHEAQHRAHAREQARVDAEEDEPVDDRLRAPEARARAVQQSDERQRDGEVGRRAHRVHGAREVVERGEHGEGRDGCGLDEVGCAQSEWSFLEIVKRH